jgi:hypothetical protein
MPLPQQNLPSYDWTPAGVPGFFTLHRSAARVIQLFAEGEEVSDLMHSMAISAYRQCISPARAARSNALRL